MNKFPDPVITAMHHADTTVTCLPVRLDSQLPAQVVAHADTSEGSPLAAGLATSAGWESAVFFVLPQSVREQEIAKIFPTTQLFPVELEADIREHANGTLIELGVSIDIGISEVLSGLILFVTGHLTSHFEAVELLGKQESLGIFLGDAHCNLLHQQRIPIAAEHSQVFNEMLQEAVNRDALIRMAGKYDPEKVFESATESL